MRSWNDYKKTFPNPSLFDFARTGDLGGLAQLLEENPELDLDAINHKGYSALMLSIYNGQEIFSEALLRGGADPNSRDFLGNTLLMGAAYKGNAKMIELLLSYGANLRLQNNSGMTAKDWAQMFGRKDVISLIEKIDPEIPSSHFLQNALKFTKLTWFMLKRKR